MWFNMIAVLMVIVIVVGGADETDSAALCYDVTANAAEQDSSVGVWCTRNLLSLPAVAVR